LEIYLKITRKTEQKELTNNGNEAYWGLQRSLLYITRI
jgi:hypothetical protein